VELEQEGVFGKILQKLSKCKTEILMMGCNLFKGSQDGGEPKKGSSPWHIGRTKGGFGSKLHAVCDGLGRAGFGKN
jgi:hypothetical protein